MNDLKTWLIEPIDPVIFGDGRPFTAVPGSRATSLPFPLPAAVAGGLRTRRGQAMGGNFDSATISRLLELVSYGPIPVLLHDDGTVAEWLFPAPSDALEMAPPENGEARLIRRLEPLTIPLGCRVARAELLPVGMPRPDTRKPYRSARPLWRWSSELRPWLDDPADRTVAVGQDWGVEGPVPEPRIHISIGPDGTAMEGKLFGTEGRGWTTQEQRLALALMTDAEIDEGIAPLGGERRLVRWKRSTVSFPDCPPSVLESARHGAVRIVLATPAVFQGGSVPEYLLRQAPSGTRLLALAHGRAQITSGWDLKKNMPKPSRRLMPAGSVLFLKLGGTKAQRESWAASTWFQPISDDTPDRRAGFGLALLGTWSGTPSELVIS